ncbi:Fasciclin 1 [Carabus blaptoides fortunei]
MDIEPTEPYINVAKTTDQLGTVVLSKLEGNPPLWITIRKDSNHDDVFINNGKILMPHSNYVSTNNGKRQVLHVIDNVLTSVVRRKTSPSPLYNPNAFQFLSQFENIDIGTHRLRNFRRKVHETNKKDIYNADGKHTFFIPVDEGFLPSQRANMLDDKVIDGHVIPNHVLFSSSTPYDTPFQTLAFGDNLKVSVTFKTETDSPAKKFSKVFIISHTLVGDSNHTAGVVQAEMVKANIPVKNGVIHLIQKPLMIIDMTISDVFQMRNDEGPFSEFYHFMLDSEVGRQFFASLKRLRDATVFAPSNAAFQYDNLRKFMANEDKMREILNMHLIKDERLSVERIRQNNQSQAQTADDRKSLYFNVITSDSELVLTVEGGGVNATVIQADIAATDGVIHIIDKVLGVPHTTVLDKLRTDPMLNVTYFLGEQQAFNSQFNDSTKRYTYFVPRDKAWRKTEISQPSTVKKLFMKEFSYHINQILERHLVISEIPYTMERLKQLASTAPNNEVTLESVGDQLKIRVEEKDESFTIIWRNKEIHVFRPDVECTNGVIHVLDLPFLQESDDITAAPSSGLIEKCPPKSENPLKKNGHGSNDSFDTDNEKIVVVRWYDNKKIEHGIDFVGIEPEDKYMKKSVSTEAICDEEKHLCMQWWQISSSGRHAELARRSVGNCTVHRQGIVRPTFKYSTSLRPGRDKSMIQGNLSERSHLHHHH